MDLTVSFDNYPFLSPCYHPSPLFFLGAVGDFNDVFIHVPFLFFSVVRFPLFLSFFVGNVASFSDLFWVWFWVVLKMFLLGGRREMW